MPVRALLLKSAKQFVVAFLVHHSMRHELVKQIFFCTLLHAYDLQVS